MTAFYNNFSVLCSNKGISESRVVEDIGLSRGVLWRWKNGSLPQNPTQKQIADYFGVTVEWLISDHSDAHFVNASPAEEPGNEFRLPVYGSISAGRGVLAEEDIIGWAYADEEYHDGEHFWLSVKGVSMEPELKNGDLVLIRKQQCLDGGQIGAFIFGGEGFVKKYLPSDDGIHLHSLNPVFPDIVVTPESYEQFQIIGKIVESRHKYY